jgi:hypothetical protein
VAERSKAWICGRLIAGIAGLNLAEGVEVRLVCCVGGSLCEEVVTLSGEFFGVYVIKKRKR